MAIERTFSIIKPNAVAKNVIGNIFARFEAAGFKIVGTKMLHLTVEQARGFYAEHDGKPFFDGLVEFMTSGPIVVSVSIRTFFATLTSSLLTAVSMLSAAIVIVTRRPRP